MILQSTESGQNYEYTVFKGMIYNDIRHERLASVGSYYTSGEVVQNTTTVTDCANALEFSVDANGKCTVDCCYGGSYDNGCDCAISIWLLLFRRIGQPSGNCTFNSKSGTLYEFSLQTGDIKESIYHCNDESQNVPLYSYQILQEPSEGSFFSLFIEYISYYPEITDPSIFTPPPQCDCTQE